MTIVAVEVFYPQEPSCYFRVGHYHDHNGPVKDIYVPGGIANHGSAVVVRYRDGSETHFVGLAYRLELRKE